MGLIMAMTQSKARASSTAPDTRDRREVAAGSVLTHAKRRGAVSREKESRSGATVDGLHRLCNIPPGRDLRHR